MNKKWMIGILIATIFVTLVGGEFAAYDIGYLTGYTLGIMVFVVIPLALLLKGAILLVAKFL